MCLALRLMFHQFNDFMLKPRDKGGAMYSRNRGFSPKKRRRSLRGLSAKNSALVGTFDGLARGRQSRPPKRHSTNPARGLAVV